MKTIWIYILGISNKNSPSINISSKAGCSALIKISTEHYCYLFNQKRNWKLQVSVSSSKQHLKIIDSSKEIKKYFKKSFFSWSIDRSLPILIHYAYRVAFIGHSAWKVIYWTSIKCKSSLLLDLSVPIFPAWIYCCMYKKNIDAKHQVGSEKI